MSGKLSQEEKESLKEKMLADRERRENSYSGYRNFMHGKTNVLTPESFKLSSKNFDKLAKARGWDADTAARNKNSFAAYTGQKQPGEAVRVRHVLQPETYNNYNKEGRASGEFLSPDNYKSSSETRNKLALPDSNDASNKTDATINPHLSNGKQHNVLEGRVAPQSSGTDGFSVDRPGGGNQILTDGGCKSGGVTFGQSRPTDGASASPRSGSAPSGGKMDSWRDSMRKNGENTPNRPQNEAKPSNGEHKPANESSKSPREQGISR